MKNSNHKKLPEEIKTGFPEEARREIEYIWDAAGEADRAASVEASEEEINQEFNRIQQKIWSVGGTGVTGLRSDTHSHSRQADKISSKFTPLQRWVAVAAVLILSVFAGVWYYLQQPVEVVAARGEFVETTLPDGTRMELNSGSKVIYDRSFGDNHRNLQLHGEAYFDVGSGEHNFNVQTRNAFVRVTGTKFNVRAWELENYVETSVALVEGSVEFASREDPNAIVALQEGFFSRIQFNETEPSQPEVRPVEEVTAWRNNGFYFSNQPLSAIFDEVERRFDINISVDSGDILNRTHSLYISEPEDAEKVVETLSHSLGFDYEVADNRFHISR